MCLYYLIKHAKMKDWCPTKYIYNLIPFFSHLIFIYIYIYMYVHIYAYDYRYI